CRFRPGAQAFESEGWAGAVSGETFAAGVVGALDAHGRVQAEATGRAPGEHVRDGIVVEQAAAQEQSRGNDRAAVPPVSEPLDLRDHEPRPARLDAGQVDLVAPRGRGTDHDVGEAADVRGVERDGERVDPAAGCVGDQDLDAADLPVTVAFGVEHAELECAGAGLDPPPALAEDAEQREDRDGHEDEQAHEVEPFEAQTAPDVRWLGWPVGSLLIAHRPRLGPAATFGVGAASAMCPPVSPASRPRARTTPERVEPRRPRRGRGSARSDGWARAQVSASAPPCTGSTPRPAR